jgi:TonB-dependent SusC/RagA subfamily outer membrane receptor
MKTIIIFILISISSYASFGQKKRKKIEGVFEKTSIDTYTIVKFYQSGLFEYEWHSHFLRRELKGVYEIKEDTLILNSSEYLNLDSTSYEFKNKKWLIVNKNNIFQGESFNKKKLYIDYHLKRNRKRQKQYKNSTSILGDSIKVIIRDGGNSGDMLVIIDNVVANKLMQKKIPPEIIKSITILKGKEAISLYGEKAKHGVIFISTKISKKNKKSQKNSLPKDSKIRE